MSRISVVMPALNAEKTLEESLDSLLGQTVKDFEVILVNDGSTDATQRIAEQYSERLNLRIVVHPERRGVSKAINSGIAASESEFIARLDSDDVAMPTRMARQLEFLETNSAIGVCGTHMEVFSPDTGPRYQLQHPCSSAAIRTAFVQRCAIAHPSVMVRRSVFDQVGVYDPRFDFAEDYELWCRASLLGIQFGNIAEPLTRYRKHVQQASHQQFRTMHERDIAIKVRYMTALLDGESPGLLPQFFSLTTVFPSKDVAMAALKHCQLPMVKLARKVPDIEEYASVVSMSLFRHLG